jgi:hypothetical protein
VYGRLKCLDDSLQMLCWLIGFTFATYRGLDLVLVQQVAIQCVTDSYADATLEPGLG